MHEGIKSYHQEIDNACNFLNHIIGELVYKSKMHLNCLQYTNVVIEDHVMPLDEQEILPSTSKNFKKSKERQHECSICKKSFFTKENLQRHQITHTNERPFTCEKCSAKFKVKSALTAHMASHNEEKPFKCHICDQAFRYFF